MCLFKYRLKELRKRWGLTQAELADQLGISRPTLTKYEQGEREPDYTTLKKIADYFNISTDYLLGRTNFEKATAIQKIVEMSGLLKKIEEIPIEEPYFSISFVAEEFYDILKEADNKEREVLLTTYFGIFSSLNIFRNDMKRAKSKNEELYAPKIFDLYLDTKNEVSEFIDRMYKHYIFEEDD